MYISKDRHAINWPPIEPCQMAQTFVFFLCKQGLTMQVLLETHDIDDRLQQICSLLQQQGYRVKCKHTGPMTNCMVYAISIGSAQR